MKKSLLLVYLFLVSEMLYGQQDLPAGQMNALDSILNIPVNSASRYWQKTGEAPASVTIITAEEIERFGYESLADALQSVRGMYISNDKNYTYIGLRGFSRPTDYNDRVILLINGHRMNENVYGSCYAGNELGLNLEGVEQIEIVRGPGSSLYGTGAMFGVINIVTKRGMTTDRLQIGAEGGSAGTFRGTASYGTYFENDIDVMVSGIFGTVKGGDLYYPEYDIPGSSDGIARHLDWEKYMGVLASVQYKGLSFQTMTTKREKGIPTGAYGIIFNDPSAKIVDEVIQTGLTYQTDIDDDKHLTVQGSYLHNFYEGVYPYDADRTADKTIGEQWMMGGNLVWDVFSTYRIIAGWEGIYCPIASYYNAGTSTIYFDKNVSSSILSAYINNDYQIADYLKLVAGLRVDGYSDVGSYVAPRIGFLITPDASTTMKLLYGDAFRAPNFAEQYYEDSLSGFKNNDRLHPEQIQTFEAILEQRLGDEYFAAVSVYRYLMDDLIDTQLDPVDSLFQYKNINAVRAHGFEVGMQARYPSGIAGYASYSNQHTDDKTTGQMLTNSPEHLIKAGAAFPLAEQITASTDWLYETKRITVYGTTTGAFLLGNVTVNVQSLMKDLDCRIKIRNLLDRRYSYPGGIEHRQATIGQEGRSVRLSLHYTFR